jgi:hypothetical protein
MKPLRFLLVMVPLFIVALTGCAFALLGWEWLEARCLWLYNKLMPA